MAQRGPRLTQIMRLSLYALGLIILIYGCFEIVERTWLTGLEMSARHMLHMVRGVFSSVVVAFFVGWMIVKNSPGFLEAAPIDEEWLQKPHPTEKERVQIYARWFIAMRWIAVLLSGILVFVSVRLVEWLPREVWWPLVLTVAALAAFNILYNLLLRWGRGIPMLLLLQGYIDLIILTLLLHFSGGVENPLSMMMIFHVIIGGILVSRRQCYWIAATASLLFAWLTWAEWAELVEHYTLQLFPHFEQQGGEMLHPAHHSAYVLSRGFLQSVILFLTAYFVTTLAERLRENERRLEAMAARALAGQQLLEQSLQTTGVGLRVLGCDLQTFWANARWKEWFECPPGTTWEGTERLTDTNSPARQTLVDGEIRVTEIVFEKGASTLPLAAANNDERVFQLTTAPLRDVSGNIQQIVELAQDITEQKQTQAQMLRAGKLATVGELAGQVAHEVNNPITIISGKLRLLLADRRSDMASDIAEELGKVLDSTHRVARVAQGLLSYCRPAIGRRIALDVREPIRKSLAMVGEMAKTGGVEIEERLFEGLPVIKANANDLEQVFLNLFLNALDAMPEGGRLTVSTSPDLLRLQNGKNAIAVVVEDSGAGIDETLRERIFEPFFTTKPDGRGTGLGLSICLGLVQSQGGEIEVGSASGHGAQFTVKLPVDT
ncbi:MAG: PAS domain-containing protein [Verrucomicrobia bacterium]|nr:PAS domain-containing protein [Verrucomicrobiota bacterium]